MTSTPTAKKEESLPVRRCTALFEFEAAEAGELSFNAGDVIEVWMFVALALGFDLRCSGDQF